MLRRAFLRLVGAAGAALASPTAAQAARKAAAPSRHVVVVGAGPAGFSAALELAERGVRVTLVEAAGEVGGKVKGWTEALEGQEVDVEHGLHGWWYQYVHFTDLLERHGLRHIFNRPDPRGTYRWPGGEIDANTPRGFRSFVRRVEGDAVALGYTDFRRQIRQGLEWLQSLTPESARRLLGGRSVTAWHTEGAPLTLWRVYTDVTAYGMYFTGPDHIDAAEFALGERFYWGGTFRNVSVRWLRGNPQTLIWEPLARRLEALGGTLRLNSRVAEVLIRDGRAAGVRVGPPPQPGFRLDEVQEGVTAIERGPELPPIFVRRQGEDYTAFMGRCTHAGCPLVLETDGFACPCHGGRFDLDGVPVAGPPLEPLERLFVDIGADGVHVEAEGPGEPIEADAVIVAVEATALGPMLGDLLPELRGLRCVPEHVARFWLDRDVSEDAGHAAIFTGLPHACNGFLVHRLQDKARAWAEQTGGAVIEIQAYRDMPEDEPREATLDRIEADLRRAWPELAEARVLKRTLTRGRTFTSFHPGWHEAANPVVTRVPGLYLAGDHVDVDRVCAFMERAVYTGRLAANAILREAGLPEAKILTARRGVLP